MHDRAECQRGKSGGPGSRKRAGIPNHKFGAFLPVGAAARAAGAPNALKVVLLLEPQPPALSQALRRAVAGNALMMGLNALQQVEDLDAAENDSEIDGQRLCRSFFPGAACPAGEGSVAPTQLTTPLNVDLDVIDAEGSMGDAAFGKEVRKRMHYCPY